MYVFVFYHYFIFSNFIYVNILYQWYHMAICVHVTLWLQKSVIDFRNNFLRLCVLKVTQQSEKHLEKILNVDEFVKRVFSVIHSNDPVARAITLRFVCLFLPFIIQYCALFVIVLQHVFVYCCYF